ncbi:hypothetical protein NUU61_001702 [Penicillium alfredii]|uniref:Uncharacterized protein n=1 Tax=Penicillium alfredii TaxID=1506179 RepID=A0A9W9KFB4_9EURO|nr:uncharacterized protein NUU61_001702 [Penicillium alfredii]KAJ5104355.1 hypothetical protein NUU61_001702 [Penicillium alfredii]
MDFQAYYKLDGGGGGGYSMNTSFCTTTDDGHLRETVQREESLKERVHALQKITDSEDEKEKAQLSQWQQELDDLQRQYWNQMQLLAIHESSLPTDLRRMYGSVRKKNPKWYLNSELNVDCARRGGCCGRDCGCCAKREPTANRTRGIGHCSVNCGCCSHIRGFDLTVEEMENVHQQLDKTLKGSNPNHLIAMTSGLFPAAPVSPPKSKPRRQPQSKSSMWKRVGHMLKR